MVSKSQLNGSLILRFSPSERWYSSKHPYWIYNPKQDVFASLTQEGIMLPNNEVSRNALSIVADVRYINDVYTLVSKCKKY